MFTVCPKCALTLVVTAADLRVAQGYVRCGRCSNVFNAIVGLSEDRSGGTPAQPGTATTSIIRKAPSISDDPPHEGLSSNTDDTEVLYAEPERDRPEVSFQDIFVEAPPPAPAPKSPPQSPPPKSAAAKGPATSPPKAAQPEPPAFTDSIPDIALEFNPAATDVTQVFVEAPPVKLDLREITGRFQQPSQAESSPPARSSPPSSRQQVTPSARPGARDERDEDELEDLRAFAAQLGATGKQQPPQSEAPSKPVALGSDTSGRSAAAKSGAPKPDGSSATGPQRQTSAPARPAASRRPSAAPSAAASSKRATGSEDVLVYRGSPYNTADEPVNLARKAAAAAARRRLAQQQAPADPEEPVYYDDGEDFDAPPADDAGAFVAANEITPRPLQRGRRLAWMGGIAALGVVLVAQAIHHNRHDLATKASLNRPLTRFYAAIGVPLVPRWNPASYEVRQLGAFSGAGDSGNLTVRASLKNDADQPLPLPLLRITVQDRYGNRIATRDVPPSGYVPGALPPDAHLGAGQRIDAEMSFKDPGRDAVGFEIDACLPTPEGGIACANDTAPVR
ncbi:MAG TPA: zinc-ribbon and DUF3426 domain-containing protein [Steroidobacteraceae bacterium]|jgi:predicted Zn finger-like uncharacterized protein|nr:zinc-ribbon and DUF3426 domain-containing protein [Steroidobacteraceae bacterium]